MKGFQKGNTIRKGCKLNNNIKEKIRLSTKGIINLKEKNGMWKGGDYICVKCGKKLANRKPKNKLCAKCFGKSISKENHYNWKNGITPINQAIRCSQKFINWRKAIFKRDNFTCQECNLRGVRIEAHHIKAFSKYPKLRFKINNGITLCKECHKKTNNYCINEKGEYY